MKRIITALKWVALLILLLGILTACGSRTTEEPPAEREAIPPLVYSPPPILLPSPDPIATPEPAQEPPPPPALSPLPDPIAVQEPRPVLELGTHILIDCDAAHETAICLTCAAILIGMMEELFDRDNGEMWGVHLRKPFMFACPISRFAVANQQDLYNRLERQAEGVYIGVLPEGVWIANTAAEAFGEMWGMVTLGYAQSRMPDVNSVVAIMIHELFHAWQPELFLGRRYTGNPIIPVTEIEARVQIMVEITALLHALASEGEARMQAIQAALSAREARQRQNPGVTRREISGEIVEGTAVYTELRFITDDLTEQVQWLVNYVDRHSRDSSLMIFGYATGALYGLLLDAFGVNWRTKLDWNTDLSALLREAAGMHTLTPFNEMDLSPFNYTQIRAAEIEWIARYEQQLAEAQRIFALPTLFVPSRGEILLYNIEMLFLPSRQRGMFYVASYGDIVYEHAFGRIVITGGHMMLFRVHEISPGGSVTFFDKITAYDMIFNEYGASTAYWTLDLNPGFYIVSREDGNYQIRGG